MEIFKIVILSLSGLLLIYAGSMRVINPLNSFCLKSYLENPGLALEGKVDVFNEMRGAGTNTVTGGIIILLGTILADFRQISFAVAAVIFLGYAAGRLISMSLEGKPNKDMVQGTYFEIILGTLNLICFVIILV